MNTLPDPCHGVEHSLTPPNRPDGHDPSTCSLCLKYEDANPPLERLETGEVLAYAVERLEQVRDLLLRHAETSKKRGRS